MSKVSATAAPAIANVVTARMGAPVTGHGRVEGAGSGNALSFGAAQFGFQKAPDNSLNDQGSFSDDSRRNPNLGRGRFTAPNEIFANISERSGTTSSTTASASEDGRPKLFAGLVSRAIATYETNAQVIHGTLPRLGTSLSIRL